MNPNLFVEELAKIRLDNVFNPYRDRCAIHDLANGPAVRQENLKSYLAAIENSEADTIWMGRDLGYRGGRRTGLALTDEKHLAEMSFSYPGAETRKATRGPQVGERTATEIWAILRFLERPPLLWNVFPFHPHEADLPFSNRKFTARELAAADELNNSLISWLGIRHIICIGQDARQYASKFGVEVSCIRHPSYGGVKDFRAGVHSLYRDQIRSPGALQINLFEDIEVSSDTPLIIH